MVQALPGSDTGALFAAPEPFLSSLLFRYSALVPIRNLSLPPGIPFNAAHDFFLTKILLNDHLKQYPPSEPYQRSFWKWALAQLEYLPRSDEDDDIDERLYVHYLSLGAENRSGPTPPSSFITHYWKFPVKFPETYDNHPTNGVYYETITLLESRTTIEAGTTGFRTWKASLVLAQFLIQHPHFVDSSNVLELGSGTGLIGILAASLQLRAAHDPSDLPAVYMTDVNSTVLARCKDNVTLLCNKSSSHPNIHYKSLDWVDSLSNPESTKSFFSEAKVDVLLGADIVFDPMLVLPLVETIFLALSSGQTRLAIIALTVRNEETLGHFLDQIGKVLVTEDVPHDIVGNSLLHIPDQVDAELEVKIFKVTRRVGA